jgi:predicted dehydrogenase
MKKILHLSRRVVKAVQRISGVSSTRVSSLASMRRPQGIPVLRCGIIGLGLMGKTHIEVLRRHPYFSLEAVASRRTEMRYLSDELGCRWFQSAEAMLASGSIDVVVIATPHWEHSALAIAALRSGLHVVCEKPLTVTATQADAVLRAAAENKCLLTVVFQGRFEPLYQRAKTLLESGELGSINRCEIVETFWRSNAYYRSSDWRATWRGEGGGVLLNQAAHVFDRYLWLCGVPKKVMGFCDTVLHEIEVEDIATAVMRHENGCHGCVHVNTTECPGLSRTEIACDRGRIIIQNGTMKIDQLHGSIRSQTANAAELFGEMEGREVSVQEKLIESAPELLTRMYQNVALAIAGQQRLLITASEAAKAVELGNAILLSSVSGRAVDLPMERAAYEALMLEKLGGGRMGGLPASV